MATVVVNPPSSLQWSGNITDIIFSGVTDHINLRIDVDDVAVEQLLLYAYNGTAKLEELSDLVEQYMLDNSKYFSNVKIYEFADENPSSTTLLCQFNVLFCSLTVSTTPAAFSQDNFLSTAHVKQFYPGMREKLYFYDPDAGTQNYVAPTLRLQVGYMDGNTMRVATVDDASSLINDCIVFSLSDIMTLASVDNVVTITLTLGARQMLYYVSDFKADSVFMFRNAFNVEENLPLNCTTSVKQVGERTVAQIKRHTVLASVEHETDYEVETAPLSPDQVLLVEQLCESLETYIWFSVFKPITISSRTCEFSDERAKEVTAKFTWRYLDGRRAYKFEALPDDEIFTEEYDPNYD